MLEGASTFSLASSVSRRMMKPPLQKNDEPPWGGGSERRETQFPSDHPSALLAIVDASKPQGCWERKPFQSKQSTYSDSEQRLVLAWQVLPASDFSLNTYQVALIKYVRIKVLRNEWRDLLTQMLAPPPEFLFQ